MALVDSAEVQRVLSRSATFRGRHCRVTSIYYRHQEEKCFRIDVDGEVDAYKLRLVTDTSRLSAANEHEALTLLHARGVSWAQEVCEYVAGEPTYLVTRFLEGRSLDTGDWWSAVYERICNVLQRRLADMHAITGTFHGHLAGPPYTSWREFLAVRFWHHVSRCEAESILLPESVRLIAKLYDDAASACEGIEPRLLHGDVKPANIVVTEEGDCHLVDYEITRFGDLDFEWVKMRWLALRWPRYRKRIAEPILAGRLPQCKVQEWPPKLVLYALYHVCAILDFERDVNVSTPTYRFDDLQQLLDIVRSRYG